MVNLWAFASITQLEHSSTSTTLNVHNWHVGHFSQPSFWLKQRRRRWKSRPQKVIKRPDCQRTDKLETKKSWMNGCYSTVTCKAFHWTRMILNQPYHKLGQSCANSWHKNDQPANNWQDCLVLLWAMLTPMKQAARKLPVQFIPFALRVKFTNPCPRISCCFSSD